MDLSSYLIKLIEMEGSDLYISSGAVPMIRVEGMIQQVAESALGKEEAEKMIFDALNEAQRQEYKENLELNLAMHIEDSGRFRVNVFQQRVGIGLVARHIKTDIPTLEDLGLPPQLKDFISEKRGLLLLVGGTGTGKSTTLASLLDYRAQTQSGHILTIEDPIEFIHAHHKSLVNQREVGIDTHSYDIALKNAMREAPDVILIGEIRDANTMRQALTYAETGHLCVSTLHANTANQALDRIINFFPHDAHAQILMDVASYLKAIVAQRLAVGVDGKRVATCEIMVNTPHISDLIQKGKIYDIKAAMDQARHLVHQTFDDDLYRLTVEGKISQKEALIHADSRNNLALMFRQNKHKFDDPKKPEKRDISYNKNAPFSKYRSFRIQPVRNGGDNNEQIVALSKALLSAFKDKGLKYDKNEPDIEVQFMFEIEHVHGQHRLEKDENTRNILSDTTADPEKEVILNINIRDLKNKVDVWRLNISHRLSDSSIGQESYDKDIARILKSYPPKKKKRPEQKPKAKLVAL